MTSGVHVLDVPWEQEENKQTATIPMYFQRVGMDYGRTGVRLRGRTGVRPRGSSASPDYDYDDE